MQACAARGTASHMMSEEERRRRLFLTMLTWAGLAGNYSDEAGAAFCHPCPALTYMHATGSDNSTDCECNAGYTGPVIRWISQQSSCLGADNMSLSGSE